MPSFDLMSLHCETDLGKGVSGGKIRAWQTSNVAQQDDITLIPVDVLGVCQLAPTSGMIVEVRRSRTLAFLVRRNAGQ